MKIICGIDEVGRGPLAGPVVSAAVILPKDDTFYRELVLTLALSSGAGGRERLKASLLDPVI